MYLPVIIQTMILAVRYRSLSLPLLANPKLTISGMVGVAKSELMMQAQNECQQAILDWYQFLVTNQPAAEQVADIMPLVKQQALDFPLVCKPDIGCRGSGVKLVKNSQQLAEVIASYPRGTSLLLQKLADYEPEVGVFYVKMPNQTQGKVVSLTFKDSPTVMGNGELTLEELVLLDPRASKLTHLYQERHPKRWQQVIPLGEVVRLVFSASHCRGAVFTDARAHITPELEQRIELIMTGLPEFYYGRLDVKYPDLDSLKRGENLQIVEINGASAESIHIWDKNTSFLEAVKTLMWQYRTLYKIGAYQRRRGFKTPGIGKLFKHLAIEKRLARYYPTTD
ncbi:D-alanine--D-alanine ligase [Saccharobesus litoralis]|uniref:D-alanine--D-alanine ligase n=2 Tax=Saccharobesus litoralis TaxID=2172099 RepID=A0A2S0VXP8_9ALTE|nr:D-alanine--D-alanine ligase [Saccharobesus litoralis]